MSDSTPAAEPEVPTSTGETKTSTTSASAKYSEIYRHPSTKNGDLVTGLEDVKTLADNWNRAVKKFGDAPIFWTLDVEAETYHPTSYNEADKQVSGFGSYLCSIGLKAGDRVGLYSINRLQWDLGEQASNCYSFVAVPIYATIGPDAVEYCVNHSETKVLVTIKENIAKCLEMNLPSVVKIVSMDDLPEDQITDKVIDWKTAVAKGLEAPVEKIPPKPLDLASITYTSGTTGKPKGVMTTHLAFASEVAALKQALHGDVGYPLGPDDRILSWLTVSHIFGRVLHAISIYCGTNLYYFRGDNKKIIEDVKIMLPTIFAGVPRIYCRLSAKIHQGIEEKPGIIQGLLSFAYNWKQGNLKNGHEGGFWDIMLGGIRKKLGMQHVRYMISGGAPLPQETGDWLQTVFCPVIQGYGLTETCGGSFAPTPTAPKWVPSGFVGTCFNCIECKLESLPEMEYLVTDKDENGKPTPRGEVLFRGPALFSGYYKNPEKTAEVIDADGWFHSGDVGCWVNDQLKIIDRAKNLMKLQQGEYVSIEYVEGVYTARVPLIEQMWVYGESTQTYVLAVIVPDMIALKAWAAHHHIEGDADALCKSDAVKKHLSSLMDHAATEAKLHGFEKVRKYHLHPSPFTEEQGLVTPSQKLKRPQLKKFFLETVQALYAAK